MKCCTLQRHLNCHLGEYEHCNEPEPLSADEEKVSGMHTAATTSSSKKSKVQMPIKLPPATSQRNDILNNTACLVNDGDLPDEEVMNYDVYS